MPPRGYKLFWRVAGSSDPYTSAGNFFTSPAVFTDPINLPGTEYEGTLTAQLRGSLCNPVDWSTIVDSGSGGSGSGSAVCKLHVFAVFGSSDAQYQITGTNCDYSPYDSGLLYVGDGDFSVCLLTGTYVINNFGDGSGAVLDNANDDCTGRITQYGIVLGTMCARPYNTVYTVSGTVVPGDTVYTDSSFTTLLTGYLFIIDPDSGIVYHLNSVTGVVGGNSGQSC